MKAKNNIDDLYYTFFGMYIILCFIMSIIILVWHVNIFYITSGILFILVILLFAYFFYKRGYIFTDYDLTIKCGFITKKYLYKDIKKCYITSNNHISFATSKKRIAIELKDKTIYISPKKMDEVLLLLIKHTGGKKK